MEALIIIMNALQTWRLAMFVLWPFQDNRTFGAQNLLILFQRKSVDLAKCLSSHYQGGVFS